MITATVQADKAPLQLNRLPVSALAALVSNKDIDVIILTPSADEKSYHTDTSLNKALDIESSDIKKLIALCKFGKKKITLTGRRTHKHNAALKGILIVPGKTKACEYCEKDQLSCPRCIQAGYRAYNEALVFANKAWNATKPALYLSGARDNRNPTLINQAYKAATDYHDPRHNSGFSTLVVLSDRADTAPHPHPEDVADTPSGLSASTTPVWLESHGKTEVIHFRI